MNLHEACKRKKEKKIQKTWDELNVEFGNPYKNGESLRTAYKNNKESLRTAYKNNKVSNGISAPVKTKTAEEIIAEEKEKQEIKKQEAKTRQEIKTAAQVSVIVDKMLEACDKVKPYGVRRIELPKSKASNTIPILMMSDIQAGTYVSKEATGGLNEYNFSVLEKQFTQLADGVVSIAVKQLSETPLLKIHMLGDMVEGLGIFPGQAYNVDRDLYDQYFGLAELIVKFLQEMLQLFGEIKIDCVAGNHGRVGKKGENPHYINWDLFLYKYLEEKMSDIKQITWNVPKSWWILDKTYDTRCLLIHGDGIRAWNGIPFYGIQRADSRYTKLLSNLDGRYDIMEMGHFHTPAEIPTPTGPIMINGCFPGASVYALKDLNTANRPEQRMFGIHKKHGKTWSFPIYLD